MTTCRYFINNPIYGAESIILTTLDKKRMNNSKRIKTENEDDDFVIQTKKSCLKKDGKPSSFSANKRVKLSPNCANKITSQKVIDPNFPEDEDFLFYGQKKTFDRANIDFSQKCCYCKQVLCEGTTYATFCYDRLVVTEEDEEYDVEESFSNVYMLLKEYERFQRSRYTNPDVFFSGVVPQCVFDTFREHFCKGKSKFNEYRLGRRGKTEKK